jgi:hemerythrin-like metal-binding protein
MMGDKKYLELTGRFQTRVPEMDAEHQQLVDIINRMYEIYHHQGSNQDLFMVLDELLAYGFKHFADEEAYMAKMGTPNLEEHKRIHHDLLDQVRRLQEQLHSGRSGVDEETFKFLQNWLMGHIVGTDVKNYGVQEAVISQMTEEELAQLANSLLDEGKAK